MGSDANEMKPHEARWKTIKFYVASVIVSELVFGALLYSFLGKGPLPGHSVRVRARARERAPAAKPRACVRGSGRLHARLA
jgi:hypothetical protein